jgi:RND family efflux transporter MFP subunit
MKKIVISAVVVAAALAGVAFYTGMFGDSAASAVEQQSGAAGGRRGGGAGGFGGGGGGVPGGGGFPGGGRGFGRQPMVVELASISRATIAQQITVVGNLVGDATVSVVPRAAGRLQEISVRLGDRVSRGQRIAKIEDFELVEQVKQAEAAMEVSEATIRQREADLQLAKTNLDRSRSLFERQLLPKQTLDDTEARYTSAVAQVDLARAQNSQSKARLDELRINFTNTVITSPVNGFVARRAADPGAFVSQNSPVVDVVDITRVRLVVNVVEKDLRELEAGDAARVEVDAFPGETFSGRIARVAPVLDPSTRTAPIEIEIPNQDFRLKPGMYARVGITTDTKKEALVAPANAVVDLGGRRGVFQPLNESAVFRTVQVGVEEGAVVEILGGLAEGDQVITTGAGALRDGDRVILPGTAGERGARGGRRGGGAPAEGGTAEGPAPQSGASDAAASASRGFRQGGTAPGAPGAPAGAGTGREGFRRGGGPPAGN